MKSKESRNSLWKRIQGLIGIVVVLTALSATIAAAVPFQVGDVFVSVGPNATLGGNVIRHYDSAGAFIENLIVPNLGYTAAGMAFDANGNLYVTLFAIQNVSKFNNTGVFQSYFGNGYNSDPESIVFDASGNAYVGQADGSRDILKFDPAGGPLATYNPAVGPRGTDWIDLAADQNTMFYTSEGSAVKRFNVGTNTNLSDFANATTAGLAGPCYALRIRSNDDVLVACTSQVYRLNATGSVVQTYPAPPNASLLFALNLDPDGTSFWTGDLGGSGEVYKIDISTGTILLTIDTETQGSIGDLAGIGVFGELTAAQPTFTVSKDFRYTNVNFSATPANLGALLPQNGSKFNVTYVTKPKDGTVSSTNPGQLYGVITINGTGAQNVTVNDTFGSQFDVNPGKLGGGVEVLRVNTTTGVASVLTNTAQVTSATVDNAGNTVNLTINLTTPLAFDEKLMIYIKFQTAEKGTVPTISNDFVNKADVLVNGGPRTASATINFNVKSGIA